MIVESTDDPVIEEIATKFSQSWETYVGFVSNRLVTQGMDYASILLLCAVGLSGETFEATRCVVPFRIYNPATGRITNATDEPIELEMGDVLFYLAGIYYAWNMKSIDFEIPEYIGEFDTTNLLMHSGRICELVKKEVFYGKPNHQQEEALVMIGIARLIKLFLSASEISLQRLLYLNIQKVLEKDKLRLSQSVSQVDKG